MEFCRSYHNKPGESHDYRSRLYLPEKLLEQIAQQGLDVLPAIIRTGINAAMQIEQQTYWVPGPAKGL